MIYNCNFFIYKWYIKEFLFDTTYLSQIKHLPQNEKISTIFLLSLLRYLLKVNNKDPITVSMLNSVFVTDFEEVWLTKITPSLETLLHDR